MKLELKHKYFKNSNSIYRLLSFTVVYSLQSKNQQFNPSRPLFSIIHGFQLISVMSAPAVLLPGCSFFEKNSVFMDSRGGFRFSNKLMPSFGLAKDESLLILRLASSFLNNMVNVNFDALRAFTLITAAAGSFPLTHTKIKTTSSFIVKPQFNFSLTKSGFNKSTLLSTVVNFYKTDVATNLSKNLAVCDSNSKIFQVIL
jgi:hypothetical protein